MAETTYARWLKKRSMVEETLRLGRVTFHIPYDPIEKLYLQFRCVRCGGCCGNQPYSGLLLTLGDIQRLSGHMGLSRKEFIERECVLAEVEEREVDAYPGMSMNATYIGYFLKRFPGETEETVTKPGRCRFLNGENLCEIHPVKPAPCRRFPYLSYIQGEVFHAYYAKSEVIGVCRGFVERKKIRRRWLKSWPDIIVNTTKEVIETVKAGLISIEEPIDIPRGKANA